MVAHLLHELADVISKEPRRSDNGSIPRGAEEGNQEVIELIGYYLRGESQVIVAPGPAYTGKTHRNQGEAMQTIHNAIAGRRTFAPAPRDSAGIRCAPSRRTTPIAAHTARSTGSPPRSMPATTEIHSDVPLASVASSHPQARDEENGRQRDSCADAGAMLFKMSLFDLRLTPLPIAKWGERAQGRVGEPAIKETGRP